jgi:peptidoglycan-associated lipoprotein
MQFSKLKMTFVSVAIALSFGVGCGKKDVKEDEGTINNSTVNADQGSSLAESMGIKTVYFPYDSSELSADAKATLRTSAGIIKGNANLRLQVVGHCDERGTEEYNMVLGEKRALKVKRFLTEQGVPADRLSHLSMGRSRPIDFGHDEAAWAKNRRAEFEVIGQ